MGNRRCGKPDTDIINISCTTIIFCNTQYMAESTTAKYLTYIILHYIYTEVPLQLVTEVPEIGTRTYLRPSGEERNKRKGLSFEIKSW